MRLAPASQSRHFASWYSTPPMDHSLRPFCQQIYTSSRDGSLKLWNIDSGEVLRTYDVGAPIEGFVSNPERSVLSSLCSAAWCIVSTLLPGAGMCASHASISARRWRHAYQGHAADCSIRAFMNAPQPWPRSSHPPAFKALLLIRLPPPCRWSALCTTRRTCQCHTRRARQAGWVARLQLRTCRQAQSRRAVQLSTACRTLHEARVCDHGACECDTLMAILWASSHVHVLPPYLRLADHTSMQPPPDCTPPPPLTAPSPPRRCCRTTWPRGRRGSCASRRLQPRRCTSARGAPTPPPSSATP